MNAVIMERKPKQKPDVNKMAAAARLPSNRRPSNPEKAGSQEEEIKANEKDNNEPNMAIKQEGEEEKEHEELERLDDCKKDAEMKWEMGRENKNLSDHSGYHACSLDVDDDVLEDRPTSQVHTL